MHKSGLVGGIIQELVWRDCRSAQKWSSWRHHPGISLRECRRVQKWSSLRNYQGISLEMFKKAQKSSMRTVGVPAQTRSRYLSNKEALQLGPVCWVKPASQMVKIINENIITAEIFLLNRSLLPQQ